MSGHSTLIVCGRIEEASDRKKYVNYLSEALALSLGDKATLFDSVFASQANDTNPPTESGEYGRHLTWVDESNQHLIQLLLHPTALQLWAGLKRACQHALTGGNSQEQVPTASLDGRLSLVYVGQVTGSDGQWLLADSPVGERLIHAWLDSSEETAGTWWPQLTKFPNVGDRIKAHLVTPQSGATTSSWTISDKRRQPMTWPIHVEVRLVQLQLLIEALDVDKMTNATSRAGLNQFADRVINQLIKPSTLKLPNESGKPSLNCPLASSQLHPLLHLFPSHGLSIQSPALLALQGFTCLLGGSYQIDDQLPNWWKLARNAPKLDAVILPDWSASGILTSQFVVAQSQIADNNHLGELIVPPAMPAQSSSSSDYLLTATPQSKWSPHMSSWLTSSLPTGGDQLPPSLTLFAKHGLGQLTLQPLLHRSGLVLAWQPAQGHLESARPLRLLLPASQLLDVPSPGHALTRLVKSLSLVKEIIVVGGSTKKPSPGSAKSTVTSTSAARERSARPNTASTTVGKTTNRPLGTSTAGRSTLDTNKKVAASTTSSSKPTPRSTVPSKTPTKPRLATTANTASNSTSKSQTRPATSKAPARPLTQKATPSSRPSTGSQTTATSKPRPTTASSTLMTNKAGPLTTGHASRQSIKQPLAASSTANKPTPKVTSTTKPIPSTRTSAPSSTVKKQPTQPKKTVTEPTPATKPTQRPKASLTSSTLRQTEKSLRDSLEAVNLTHDDSHPDELVNKPNDETNQVPVGSSLLTVNDDPFTCPANFIEPGKELPPVDPLATLKESGMTEPATPIIPMEHIDDSILKQELLMNGDAGHFVPPARDDNDSLLLKSTEQVEVPSFAPPPSTTQYLESTPDVPPCSTAMDESSMTVDQNRHTQSPDLLTSSLTSDLQHAPPLTGDEISSSLSKGDYTSSDQTPSLSHGEQPDRLIESDEAITSNTTTPCSTNPFDSPDLYPVHHFNPSSVDSRVPQDLEDEDDEEPLHQGEIEPSYLTPFDEFMEKNSAGRAMDHLHDDVAGVDETNPFASKITSDMPQHTDPSPPIATHPSDDLSAPESNHRQEIDRDVSSEVYVNLDKHIDDHHQLTTPNEPESTCKKDSQSEVIHETPEGDPAPIDPLYIASHTDHWKQLNTSPPQTSPNIASENPFGDKEPASTTTSDLPPTESHHHHLDAIKDDPFSSYSFKSGGEHVSQGFTDLLASDGGTFDHVRSRADEGYDAAATFFSGAADQFRESGGNVSHDDLTEPPASPGSGPELGDDQRTPHLAPDSLDELLQATTTIDQQRHDEGEEGAALEKFMHSFDGHEQQQQFEPADSTTTLDPLEVEIGDRPSSIDLDSHGQQQRDEEADNRVISPCSETSIDSVVHQPSHPLASPSPGLGQQPTQLDDEFVTGLTDISNTSLQEADSGGIDDNSPDIHESITTGLSDVSTTSFENAHPHDLHDNLQRQHDIHESIPTGPSEVSTTILEDAHQHSDDKISDYHDGNYESVTGPSDVSTTNFGALKHESDHPGDLHHHNFNYESVTGSSDIPTTNFEDALRHEADHHEDHGNYESAIDAPDMSTLSSDARHQHMDEIEPHHEDNRKSVPAPSDVSTTSIENTHQHNDDEIDHHLRNTQESVTGLSEVSTTSFEDAHKQISEADLHSYGIHESITGPAEVSTTSLEASYHHHMDEIDHHEQLHHQHDNHKSTTGYPDEPVATFDESDHHEVLHPEDHHHQQEPTSTLDGVDYLEQSLGLPDTSVPDTYEEGHHHSHDNEYGLMDVTTGSELPPTNGQKPSTTAFSALNKLAGSIRDDHQGPLIGGDHSLLAADGSLFGDDNNNSLSSSLFHHHTTGNGHGPLPGTDDLPADSTGTNHFDPIESWGKPQGLPPPNRPTSSSRLAARKTVSAAPTRTGRSTASTVGAAKSTPAPTSLPAGPTIHLDVVWVPDYLPYVSPSLAADFFARVRSRVYILSGEALHPLVGEALLAGKAKWTAEDISLLCKKPKVANGDIGESDPHLITLLPTDEPREWRQWLRTACGRADQASGESRLIDQGFRLMPAASLCDTDFTAGSDQCVRCEGVRVDL